MTTSAYDAAVLDLLGVLAYGELSAFEDLAAAAALAPDLEDKARLAALAAAELRHFELLRDRLTAGGVPVWEAMDGVAGAFDDFHAHTKPSTWLEGVVKAYVGNGMAVDFYREIAGLVDEQTSALVAEVLDDTGQAEFAVDRVRQAIEEDPALAGRLGLWGRRIVGEAMAQAQHVIVDQEALAALLAGRDGGFDIEVVQRLFLRIAEHHSRRMSSLGLSS